MLVVIALMTSS